MISRKDALNHPRFKIDYENHLCEPYTTIYWIDDNKSSHVIWCKRTGHRAAISIIQSILERKMVEHNALVTKEPLESFIEDICKDEIDDLDYNPTRKEVVTWIKKWMKRK